MKNQLYIYDCLTGKLRVSDGDFMAIGSGKQNTFRIKTKAEISGVFAQRNGVCRFFLHNKVARYSINGNDMAETAHIKPNRIYLFVLSGGCFIAWFGDEESRPNFGAFDSNCWYVYHPEKDEWSDAIELSQLLKTCRTYDDCVLATFQGLEHNAYRLGDLREVADFINTGNELAHTSYKVKNNVKDGFCCPSCRECFVPGEALAIAVHPQLMGDSILGENAMKRFIPTNKNTKGQVMDDMGAICSEFACPVCHHKLPPFFEKTQHHRIAIIGVPSSGKAYYLASVVHQMEREMPRDFNIPFRDADPENNAALNNMRIRVFYSSTAEEFREGRDYLHGQLRRSVWRNNVYEKISNPFIFTLNKQSSAHSLIFYDGACECGNHPATSTPFDNDSLRGVDALFCMFDPCLEPAFRDIITGFNSLVAGAPSKAVCRQSLILSDIDIKLRQMYNMPPGEKMDIPIAVVVSKWDIWKELLGPEPLLPTVRNGRLKYDNILANSARIRDLLFHLVPEICTNAEAISNKVCYFAVSSYGEAPEAYLDELTGDMFAAPEDGKLTPFHVTDPALWLLQQEECGLFPDV